MNINNFKMVLKIQLYSEICCGCRVEGAINKEYHNSTVKLN